MIMRGLLILALIGGAIAWGLSNAAQKQFPLSDDYIPDRKNGAYMAVAAGCVSCHSSQKGDELIMDGGVIVASPFGDIITPNISSSIEHGIGDWSRNDFLNAVINGVSPSNQHYYPAMPYTHFNGLEVKDTLDIHAYILSLPRSHNEPQKTQLSFPFNIRRGVGLWKQANKVSDRLTKEKPIGSRGEYLVENAAHCGACHTPRNFILGTNHAKRFDGAVLFDGTFAPPIPPLRLAAAGEDTFINSVFKDYKKLDGSPITDEKMRRVAEDISELTDDDRRAIYTYLTHSAQVSHAPATQPTEQDVVNNSAITSELGASGDAMRGANLYPDLCGACHSIDQNQYGPRHRGVYGSQAGKLEDYNYSDALKGSNIIWNEKNLDSWLASPDDFIPGNRMGVSIANAQQRADIVAYLKTLTE